MIPSNLFMTVVCQLGHPVYSPDPIVSEYSVLKCEIHNSYASVTWHVNFVQC